MDEGLLTEEKLRNSYLNLKKASDQVKKDYNRFMSEEFTDQDWRNEGRKINNNIQKFEKLYDELEQALENAKDEENFDSQTIQTVEEGLKSIRSVQSNIRAMKDKIASANYNIEMLDQQNPEENEDDQQQGQVVMNLMQNKEVLEQRGKALQEIHKTAALIKDTTDKMAQDLVQQGEMLDDVEQHVVKAEDNVNKAEKEIKRADELSRGNTKRLAYIIVIVVVAIGAVLAIVLSLVLKNKNK
jgi:t-SNARE complex subunit (syntaxin)